ncbi:MAG: hypothetical protein VKK04_20025 [Synechococcales bacterium]|nr:hypothetical protein [Synechococcales bacterium]
MNIYRPALLYFLPLLIGFLVCQRPVQARPAAMVVEQSIREETGDRRARIYTINLTLMLEGSHALNDLIQQAQQAAQPLIGQTFAENPAITDVVVNVLGEQSGTIVPLLVVQIPRAEWRSPTTIADWEQSMGMTPRFLLGLAEADRSSQGRPSVAPVSFAPAGEVSRGRSSRIRRLLF